MTRITQAALLALLWAPARAAGAAEPTTFIQPSYWLKTYSLSPFKEHWTVTVAVKDLGRDLPRIRDEFSKVKAQLRQSFENYATSKAERSQQLSYRLSGPAAKTILKKLKKMGAVDQALVRPELDLPPLDEVKAKIGKLIAVKKNHAALLKRMPDVAAIVDEILEHLLFVEHLQEDDGSAVLLNITVRQKD